MKWDLIFKPRPSVALLLLFVCFYTFSADQEFQESDGLHGISLFRLYLPRCAHVSPGHFLIFWAGHSSSLMKNRIDVRWIAGPDPGRTPLATTWWWSLSLHFSKFDWCRGWGKLSLEKPSSAGLRTGNFQIENAAEIATNRCLCPSNQVLLIDPTDTLYVYEYIL